MNPPHTCTDPHGGNGAWGQLSTAGHLAQVTTQNPCAPGQRCLFTATKGCRINIWSCITSRYCGHRTVEFYKVIPRPLGGLIRPKPLKIIKLILALKKLLLKKVKYNLTSVRNKIQPPLQRYS